MTKQRGFTIVELLIVIVVIAIIASITTTVFAGIQIRTANQTRTEATRQLTNLVKVYITTNGAAAFKSALPSNNGGCLGENYIDVSPANENLCYYTVINGIEYVRQNTPALDTALRSAGNYRIGYPVLITQYDASTSIKYSAPSIFYTDTKNTYVNGSLSNFRYIYYTLDGADQDCLLKPSMVRVAPISGRQAYRNDTGAKNSGTTTYPSGRSVTECQQFFHPDTVV